MPASLETGQNKTHKTVHFLLQSCALELNMRGRNPSEVCLRHKNKCLGKWYYVLHLEQAYEKEILKEFIRRDELLRMLESAHMAYYGLCDFFGARKAGELKRPYAEAATPRRHDHAVLAHAYVHVQLFSQNEGGISSNLKEP